MMRMPRPPSHPPQVQGETRGGVHNRVRRLLSAIGLIGLSETSGSPPVYAQSAQVEDECEGPSHIPPASLSTGFADRTATINGVSPIERS